MKAREHCGVVAAAMLLVASNAFLPAFAGEQTVGDFVVKIAELKNLTATDGKMAARSLRTAGYVVPVLDLNKALTEGDVVAISKSFGIRVTTSTPDAAFDKGRVDTYLAIFGGDLGKLGNPGDGKHMPTGHKNGKGSKGKGKKLGHFKSPSQPE